MPADVYSTAGYFAVIPEWILDADISAQAVRAYAVLARYADQRTGHAHPSRKTLAERMRVADVKTVDRALEQLVEIGALELFHRWRSEDGETSRVMDPEHRERTSNGYVLHPARRGRIRGGGPPSGATPPLPPEGEELEPSNERDPLPTDAAVAGPSSAPGNRREHGTNPRALGTNPRAVEAAADADAAAAERARALEARRREAHELAWLREAQRTAAPAALAAARRAVVEALARQSPTAPHETRAPLPYLPPD